MTDEEYIAQGKTGAEQELRRAVVDSVNEDYTDVRHGPVDQYDDNDDIHDSYRPNDDGTVTYISPSGGEHTYDPDDLDPNAAP